MGVIWAARCEKCEYEKRLFLGGGLKDCEMRTLNGVIPKKLYWKLKAALATMRPGGFSIDRRAGYCKQCGDLCVAPVVEFESTEGKKRSIEGFCPQCEGEMDFLEYTGAMPEKITCPKCGGELQTRAEGRWD